MSRCQRGQSTPIATKFNVLSLRATVSSAVDFETIASVYSTWCVCLSVSVLCVYLQTGWSWQMMMDFFTVKYQSFLYTLLSWAAFSMLHFEEVNLHFHTALSLSLGFIRETCSNSETLRFPASELKNTTVLCCSARQSAVISCLTMFWKMTVVFHYANKQ